MAEVWPDTLPQCFLNGTLQYQWGDGRLRTPAEAGPAKSRRRTSAVSDFLTGQMKMTTEQKGLLDEFIRTTIQDGDPFLFPDPDDITASGADILVRFADSMPQGARAGGAVWIVTLSLEVLP